MPFRDPKYLLFLTYFLLRSSMGYYILLSFNFFFILSIPFFTILPDEPIEDFISSEMEMFVRARD